MADKHPKKQTLKDDELNLVEAEELPEYSKDYQPSKLSSSIPGSLDSASVTDERSEVASSSAESRSSGSSASATPKFLRSVPRPYRHPDSPVSARSRSSKSCSPTYRRTARSTHRGSDSTSGVDVRFGSPEGTSSSAESRSGGSSTGAIPKVFQSSPDANRKTDSEAAKTGSAEGSPRGSGSTPRRRSHSLSSIGTKIKSAAAAIKTSIVSPRFRRKDAENRSSAGDTIPLMQEENESGDIVEEPVESKPALPDNPTEEKMETSPAREATDVDDSMEGASSGKMVEKDDIPQHLEKAVHERQLSTESTEDSNLTENSNLTDDMRRKLSAATTSEIWKKIKWSADSPIDSPKSSLPGTGTTSAESLSADDSADVDSYEEALIQGRRRQRDSSSPEEEEEDSEELDGGPSKRPALERQDKDDDEGPSDQPMPLPVVERLI